MAGGQTPPPLSIKTPVLSSLSVCWPSHAQDHHAGAMLGLAKAQEVPAANLGGLLGETRQSSSKFLKPQGSSQAR